MVGSLHRPNVLLVVLDSIRAANCSRYGYRRSTTPFLESFAGEARTFTQARAPSNWSLPSHVSLFTGLETHEHRVTVHDRLLDGHTVFETLAGRGYRTGLFTENGFVASHDVGLKNAFETVTDVPAEFPDRYDTADLNPGPDGFYYADAFASWTRDRSGPWAACVNLMDAHRPFEPRAPYDRWSDQRARELQRSLPSRWEWTFHGGDRPYWELEALERLYDGGIRQVDAVLEQIVTSLRVDGALEETLVVICGDHGDGFGEPGLLSEEPPAVSHIVPMHETLLHVPLIVRPPGGAKGTVDPRPAALTKFPDVALATVDGDADEGRGFGTDAVHSTKQPITGDLRERFEGNCERVDRFLAESRSVYVPDPDVRGAVRKRYYWGEDAVECRVRPRGGVEILDRIDPALVDADFEDRDPGVREPLEGHQVTDSTQKQLAALGYY